MHSALKVICQLVTFSLVSAPLLPAATVEERLEALEAQVAALTRENADLKQQASVDAKAARAPVPVAPAPAAQTPAKVTTTPTLSEKGLTFATSDGASSFHIGSLVQFDSRMFFGDGGGVYNNSFYLRRARLITDGTFGKIFSFLLVPEVGGGTAGTASTASIYDASISIAFSPAVQLKFGKFKTPIGWEGLQGDPATSFAERSLASNLTPNRDVGLQLGGSFQNGTVSYALGLFNGTPDSLTSSGNSDFDNDKDLEGHLYLLPFKNDKDSALKGLTIGFGGSLGREKGTAAVTSGYKTAGQQTFFKFNSTATADGQLWRVSPQLDYRIGPFGLMSEYIASTGNGRATNTLTSPKVALTNKAWYVTASFVLTGEASSYAGVTPNHPFSLENHTWGAWEIAARCDNLKIDDKAFPAFASITSNANEATGYSIGLNWYLTRNMKIAQDFFLTRFGLKVPVPSSQILRQDEKALTTRFQFSF